MQKILYIYIYILDNLLLLVQPFFFKLNLDKKYIAMAIYGALP